MNTYQLFSRLKEHDVVVRLAGENIKISAPAGHLPPELLMEIKEHKSEIIEFLKKHQQKQEKFTAIKRVEERRYYPLSAAQERLYVMHRMVENNLSYNMPALMELAGELDREKMTAVFRRLIERHESLRTSFHLVDGQPAQRIHSPRQVNFEIENHETNNSQDVHNVIRGFIRPFDLIKAPLFRVGLVKLTAPLQRSTIYQEDTSASPGAAGGGSPGAAGAAPLLETGAAGCHLLMLDMHHMVSDGTSIGIITREFVALYAGQELAPLPLQYKDYVVWQGSREHKDAVKEQELFWVGQFKGELPLLNLPADYPRPPAPAFLGRTARFTIGPEESAALQRIALDRGATLFMVLLALYNILLAKLSGQEDIVVGTPAAGRAHADLGGIVGMFVNTLCLRNYPRAERTFAGFLAEVKEKTLDAFDNQQFQFEDLVEKLPVQRGGSRNPLFDAMFALQNMEIGALKIPGLALRAYDDYDTGAVKFNLNLHVYEVDAGLTGTLQYSTEIFKAGTGERFLGYFKKIAAVVGAEPDIPIAAIDMLPDEEKKRLLYDFNDTAADFPAHKTLQQLFAEQVEKIPDDTAVIRAFPGTGPGEAETGPRELSYGRLNERAAALAQRLRAKGVGPGSIVGLMTQLSAAAVTAILAVLKAGAAFLPIDPVYPPSRKRFVMRDSGIGALLTTETLFTRDDAPAPLDAAGNILFIDDESLYIPVESVSPEVHHPEHPAYIIYTSGSSGQPKGVVVSQRSAVHYITWAIKNYVRGEELNFPLFTSLAFDLTVTSVFTPLLSGNSLLVYGESETGSAVEQVIADDRLGVVKLTPSHLKLVLASAASGSPGAGKISTGIKRLIVGGEALDTALARDISRIFPQPVEIYNEYGPTEAAVGCMIYKYDPDRDNRQSVPIGVPADNMQVYVLDKNGRPVPTGVSGELYIAGTGVALGYVNRPELTAEKFLPTNGTSRSNRPDRSYESNMSYRTYSPNHPSPVTLYKTGDMARFLHDGNIEFLGRMDQQVKIRGFRVEPGEIENELKSFRRGSPVSPADSAAISGRMQEIRRCRTCLLPEDYPGISFDAEGICTVCRGYEKYRSEAAAYFEKEADFTALLQRTKETKQGEYDCLLLFSGGKDSTYVLYRLIDMGLKVLTFTFDNGYISEAAFANIKKTTADLGVENIVCRTPRMNHVFLESLFTANSVCHGCWNALNTLGAHAAHERNINLVLSGLSKGQIFEMRLEGLFQQGIFSAEEIEKNLLLFRKNFHSENNKYTRLLDVSLPEEVVEQIHFVDFFRYFDTPVQEIRDYLAGKGWVPPADTGFCSSNCVINDVGIHVFLKERGCHFYAAPLSWDCRLNVIPREQGIEEIAFINRAQEVNRILGEIGYYDSPIKDAVVLDTENSAGEKNLTAYILADEQLTAAELREYLNNRLPAYMVPAHFIQVDSIPLTANGKVDRRALELSGSRMETGSAYAPPGSEIEEKLAAVWSEVLGIETVSVDSSFFELGGDSLSLLRMNAAVKESFDRSIPINTMFRLSTIRQLAEYIQEGSIDLQASEEVLEKNLDTLDETVNLLMNEDDE